MLVGKKIKLRSLRESDLNFLLNIENNCDNWIFGSENKKYTVQEMKNYISNSKVGITIAKQFRYVIEKEKPIGLWEKLAPKEYGFWANVNPNVPHPRWSQSKEQLLGTNEFQKTQIYNGYEENVSYLYSNFSQQEKLKLFR